MQQSIFDKIIRGTVGRITMNYQEMFHDILDEMKKGISGFKTDVLGLQSGFSKLEADIQVAKT